MSQIFSVVSNNRVWVTNRTLKSVSCNISKALETGRLASKLSYTELVLVMECSQAGMMCKLKSSLTHNVAMVSNFLKSPEKVNLTAVVFIQA